ncbi:RNA polymerase recycling motor HelD [Bacillus dakarensis]|uniref:RNA polymerase recycling motor HelD n=1 Tax=Robertmurraya dakarensis TaxID=1926278 RepID=UPI00098262FA|nr:RNA polymerase recycling motor HelD [Bacillus dakarensis]
MSKEQIEKEYEQRRVGLIVEAIQEKIDTLGQQVNKVGSDALEIRTTFWDDVTVNVDEPDDLAETFSSIKQQAQLLSERERSHLQLNRKLHSLQRLKNSPYFGRVDFKEDAEQEAESIYIGITSFMDKDDENFLIYDWRAPISSIYYDYSPGRADYKTPEGIIEGEMTLKRQFIIRNSVIQGMFDTGVTIGDQLLQEVLGNQADSHMKTIVATIQKEQNRIIRNEKSKYLIVQGVAGSGKTSAALQRVAYLLYQNRGSLSSQNIMLFSPNPLFNSYVATVLPELGEENMQQTTFLEYLQSRIGVSLKLEDSFTQLEYLLNNEVSELYKSRVSGIVYKSSLDFKKLIDRYLEFLGKEGMQFKDISMKDQVLLSARQIKEQFYAYDKDISIPNRIELLQEWIKKELKKRKKLEKRKDWVKDEAQFLDKEDFLEVFNKLEKKKRYRENSFDDFELEEKLLSEIVVNRYFKPIMKKVKKLAYIDYEEIYRGLFQVDIIENLACKFPDNWNEICKYSNDTLLRAELAFEDATPFVYLKDGIEGKASYSSIRHVFVDEAQDYSAFQFAYLRELFPFSKMTFLGDINQGIYSHSTEAESFLPKDIKKEEQERIILTRSYRSTRQIVEFTKTILKNGEHIEPFNRNGKKPSLTFVDDEESLKSCILNEVQQKIHSDFETIAIICKTAKQSAKAYEFLKEHHSVRLIEKGTISFEKGVLVIPAYLAKGIEFDSVIIYDASKETYGKESERRLLYTACTRAMHELSIFSMGEMSPFIESGLDYLNIKNQI